MSAAVGHTSESHQVHSVGSISSGLGSPDLDAISNNITDLRNDRPFPGVAKTNHPMRDAPKVRIYRPARNPMQSGRANTKNWLIEFEPQTPPFIDPLMGWTGSKDTLQQVRLKFATREQAIAFAKKQGRDYSISEPHELKVRPKSYADNFLWRPRSKASGIGE